ncbi:MAG: hypothetical protein JRJ82_09480 [Deltaproteobacteria bacterium]|nr:hypothetical protein [Deltaproteobacteria bacterium]
MMSSQKTQHSWRFILCVIAIPTALLLGVSCSVLWLGHTTWEPPHLVSVEGEKNCAVTYWHGLKLFAPVQKGQAIPVPMRNDDFLFTEDDRFFLYRSSDGQSLALSGNKARTILKGRTVSLKLDQDEAWKWLKKASPEELKGLRFLNIEGELNAQQVDQVKRIAKVNPKVGLFIEDETWRGIARLFDPVLLIIDGGLQEQDRDILAKKKDIRTLGMVKPDYALDFLSEIVGLQTLIIHDWDPQKTGPFPDNLASLHRIVLIDPVIANLSALGKQPNLFEMNIQGAKSLEDFTLLKRYHELRLLSLHELKKELDLGHLKSLKKLKWLSLPESTTQEQLVDIIQSRPDLVFLDLSGCEKITELTPLQKLPSLQYLMVNIGHTSSDPLYEMKHLRWLAVAGEKEKQEKGLAGDLQKTLLDTDVVRLEPFCLGSGWILLVLPVIAGSWWITRRRKRVGLLVSGDHG